MVLNTTGSDVERLMRDGQAAAKRGDKVIARALLTQVLERDPHNEKAWMWLSGAVADLYEQQTCLENVLIINPNNAHARKGLEFVVAKTGTHSQVLDTLNASPPAPVPMRPEPNADPFASAGSESQAQDQLSQNTYSGSAASAGSTGGDFSPWAMPISEHTSPLQDVPELPDYPDFRLPDPGAGVLPPWEQLPPQPAPASASAHDLPWSVANTLSPNLTSIGLGDGQQSISTDESLPMPDLGHLTDGWDAASQSFAAAPQAANTSVDYTGGPPTPGLAPDLDAAVPDWVRQAQDPQPTQAQSSPYQPPEMFDIQGIEPFTPFDAEGETPVQLQHTPGSLPAEDVAAVENGIDAWLSQVAAHQAAQEASGLPPTDFPVSSSPAGNDTQATNGAGVRDPFAVVDLGPMGPYTANALPSPDELPGAHKTNQAQPWYLQGSGDKIDSPPETPGDHNWTTYGNYSEGQDENAQAPRDPVATIECPNCRKQVPETSLACPECRYNFFVHCPGCHELVDTTEARAGVVDSCPYCSIPVNRFELGLMYAKDLSTPVLAAPIEDKDAWVGAVMEPPKQGFHFSVAWLVDVLWLLAIALVVWALTQLPAWFNMTNLYN